MSEKLSQKFKIEYWWLHIFFSFEKKTFNERDMTDRTEFKESPKIRDFGLEVEKLRTLSLSDEFWRVHLVKNFSSVRSKRRYQTCHRSCVILGDDFINKNDIECENDIVDDNEIVTETVSVLG